jgi:hypothetical protein
MTSILDSYEFFHPTSTLIHSMFPPSYPFSSEDDILVRRTSAAQPATATPPPLYVPLHTETEEEDTKEYPCTTTMPSLVSIHAGGLWTVCPNTVTKTETLDCVGCRVVKRPWGGPGPVVSYQGTVTDLKPRTETTYVCKPTS